MWLLLLRILRINKGGSAFVLVLRDLDNGATCMKLIATRLQTHAIVS